MKGENRIKEEINFLKLHIEQITQANSVLTKELEDQIEISKEAKRTLSISYIKY